MSAELHSPISVHSSTPTGPAAAPAIVSSPSSIRSSFVHRDGVLPPRLDPPKVPLPATPATPTTPSSIRLPFFEKFKNKLPELDISRPVELKKAASPPSPETDSDSEYGGLAYAESAADEAESSLSPRQSATPGKVRFPSVAGSESRYSASQGAPSPRLPQRSLSASTGTSSYSVRSAAKSTGALDRALETLFEDPMSPTTTASPGMFTKQLSPDGQQRDSKPPKLPARSHTSPTLGRSDLKVKKHHVRVKMCIKCDKAIDDGRWIQMDGGGVLCDRCWKNMYLPKVRACVAGTCPCVWRS